MCFRLLAILLAVSLLPDIALPCTAFVSSNRKTVLVGNNEDDNNPFTVLWFVPAGTAKYGRLYVGYDDYELQGGMNERGLWFDAFATAPVEATNSAQKPKYPHNLIDKAMSECATVDEVLRLFDQYNVGFLKKAVLMFADASGDSAVIEPNAIIRKRGRFQVQTNFHQSFATPEYQCDRFAIASSMLETAGDRISPELFRRILAATHSEGEYPTVYSNVYDLKRRVLYLYHYHNYENVVVVDLQAELKKPPRAVAIPSLFPKSFSAYTYQQLRAEQLNRVEPPVVQVDPATFDAFTGFYRLENGVHFAILHEKDKLMLDADPLGKVELFPSSASTFFLRVSNSRITFLREPDGSVNEVSAVINGQPSPGRKQR